METGQVFSKRTGVEIQACEPLDKAKTMLHTAKG
jgi:hypothetical protein